ncbi:amidohydrolase family protein [Natronoglycomyces albus]|uniref:Amidohydrolase family protein n=1 Tax=Natronoglycomyces albus TaxID=2811108 RepID=A0A895XUB7_9ACTN|nr:amidohydrolase family protein [Natronoglycomyces albus]QSB05840.1 amidohydrolase family protein [Natronoglycomyces albus]
MHIFKAPTVVPIASDVIANGAVAVDEGKIVYVGPADQAPECDDVTEFTGVMMPGLVNAHTHLCYSSFSDMYTNEKEFFEWIQEFARRNPTLSDEEWRASVQAGIDESLRHGVTAVADVVSPAPALSTVLSSELAGVAYWEACLIDNNGWEQQRNTWRDVLTESRATNNSAMDVGISPHTLYTIGTGVAKSLAELARTFEIRLHPHLAETEHEDLYVRHGAGPFAFMARRMGAEFEIAANGGEGHSPTVQMEKSRLLGSDSHVAHGVHVDEDDRKILLKNETAVALCARSNKRLGAGEAPVAAYRAAGNKVAIGTDSRASAPDLDVAGEWMPLKRLALSQGDTGAGLDEWLVRAATEGGADAMGRSDIGRLVEGARADLAVFDVQGSSNAYSALVSDAAGRCSATVVAGRLIKHEQVS